MVKKTEHCFPEDLSFQNAHLSLRLREVFKVSYSLLFQPILSQKAHTQYFTESIPPSSAHSFFLFFPFQSLFRLCIIFQFTSASLSEIPSVSNIQRTLGNATSSFLVHFLLSITQIEHIAAWKWDLPHLLTNSSVRDAVRRMNSVLLSLPCLAFRKVFFFFF